MIAPKFKVGDKVRLTNRVPEEIRQNVSARTRTVVKAFYDPVHECCYYQLGAKGKGELGYWFRSYMLRKIRPEQAHHVGRPKKKRSYHRKIQDKTLPPQISI